MNADGSRRMKTGHDHLVSLPTQTIEMLREMQQFSGGADHVFPAVGKLKNPHLHRDALSRALRLMGFAGEHSPHGFRAMLRTIARERLKIDFDVLKRSLRTPSGIKFRLLTTELGLSTNGARPCKGGPTTWMSRLRKQLGPDRYLPPSTVCALMRT